MTTTGFGPGKKFPTPCTDQAWCEKVIKKQTWTVIITQQVVIVPRIAVPSMSIRRRPSKPARRPLLPQRPKINPWTLIYIPEKTAHSRFRTQPSSLLMYDGLGPRRRRLSATGEAKEQKGDYNAEAEALFFRLKAAHALEKARLLSAIRQWKLRLQNAVSSEETEAIKERIKRLRQQIVQNHKQIIHEFEQKWSEAYPDD